MEIQIRRHSYDLSRHNPTSFSKLFDDIPTFEEAFDPASLRKFFQEYESTNSQSTYSPQKDRLILEDIHSQGTNEHDFLFSPSSHLLNDFQTYGDSRSSKYNFSFNFNLGPKGLNVKPSSPGNLSQGLPFTISQFPKRAISKVLDIHADTIQEKINSELNRIEITEFEKTSQESERDEESSFERKLRKKQIFKVIKEAKPKETSLNVKRKHSAPVNENLDPLVKRVKGATNVRRASTEIRLSVKGSVLKNNNSATSSVFQNKISNF